MSNDIKADMIRRFRCPKCGSPDIDDSCPTCYGSGGGLSPQTCPTCVGTGIIDMWTCVKCGHTWKKEDK